MKLKQIHSYFSFGSLAKLAIGLAAGIQLIIILFNHISGFYILNNAGEFLQRFLFGTILTFIAGMLLAYPDSLIIHWLNRIAPWGKATFKRISIQLPVTLIYAALIGLLFTLVSHLFGRYKEDVVYIAVINMLISAGFNLFLMGILEGWLFYIDSKRAKEKEAKLKQELTQIKFEALKSQINPHFMFNSLNVLSGLIQLDSEKAQQFIDEFSHIYRYVIESIEQPVVQLRRELDFTRSYLFLQQIRYGEALTYTVNLPAELMEYYLPPLSLQVILENATKHNIINDEQPLGIDITAEDRTLVIRNRLQPKMSGSRTTGIGLKNLRKRYALVSKREPDFRVETDFYTARLPLLEME